jgi:hypothetical protein
MEEEKTIAAASSSAALASVSLSIDDVSLCLSSVNRGRVGKRRRGEEKAAVDEEKKEERRKTLEAGQHILRAARAPRTLITYKQRLTMYAKWLWKDNRFAMMLSIDPTDSTFDAWKHIVVPVTHDAIMQFFYHLVKGAKEKDDVKSDNESSVSQVYAYDYVRQYKSAIVYLYQLHSKVFPQSLDNEIEQLLKGYKRTLARLKSDGKVTNTEGKQHLSFTAYVMLAKKLLSSSVDDYTSVFAWCWLVLQWNLFCRSDTTASILLTHVSWSEDSMVITIPKHKSDQDGRQGKTPMHVFANPSNLSICPITAIAVFFFTTLSRTDNRLFEGNDQEKRFSNRLHKCLESLSSSELTNLGNVGSVKDIGTHSLRKGGITYCSNYVNGPPSDAIDLRAGHSIGKVRDRYHKLSQGNSQFVGRTVCGADFNDIAFCALPPRFKTHAQFTDDFWYNILGTVYNKLPLCFKSTLPYLLASLINATPFLRNVLHSGHPLFKTRLYASGIIIEDKLDEGILLGHYHCPVTNMHATGLPPHFVLLKDLGAKLDAANAELKSLKSSVKELPKDVTAEQLKHIVVNGAVPIMHDDLERMKTDMTGSFSALITTLFERLKPCDNMQEEKKVPSVEPPYKQALHSWIHPKSKDKTQPAMHRVPKDWKPPSSLQCKNIWELWYHGDQSNKIAAYKFIDSSEDLCTKPAQIELARIKGVMKELAKYIPTSYRDTDISELPMMQSSSVFDEAMNNFIADLLKYKIVDNSCMPRYKAQWKVTTIYNHVGALKTARKEEQLRSQQQSLHQYLVQQQH